MTNFRYLSNVTTLELNEEKCIGCEVCTQVCPHGVFEIKDRKAIIVDKDACMECGACAKNCVKKAITVASGVGCAAAIIIGAIKGTEPTCGCGSEETLQPQASCCDSKKPGKNSSCC